MCIVFLGKNRKMRAFRRKYESQIADAFSHRYSSGIIALRGGVGVTLSPPYVYIYIYPSFVSFSPLPLVCITSAPVLFALCFLFSLSLSF